MRAMSNILKSECSDRFKLFSNRTLYKQLMQYKKLGRLKTKRERIAMICYNLLNQWTQIFAMTIALPFQIKNTVKNSEKIKLFWRTLLE